MKKRIADVGNVLVKLFCIASFLLLALTISGKVVSYGIVTVKCSGDSMMPSIKDGDMFIGYHYPGQKFDYGDVVGVWCEEKNETLLKRIIGLPGDTIKVDCGKVYVNGILNQDFYFDEKASDISKYKSFELILKDDEIFVLGDNRNHSYDSRYRDVNPFKISDIKEKIIID